MSNQLKKEASSKLPFFISYFISDPILFNNLNKIISKYSPDMVCFRDKQTKNIDTLVKDFIKTTKQHNIGLTLINTHINLAIKYRYDGVHLNSQQFNDIKKAKDKNLFTIISCHNEDEIILAKQLGADGITYSPIFDTPNKGEPKGVEMLGDIVYKYKDENFIIIALGGIINNQHIEQIIKTKADGFASIRYFSNI